MPCYHPIPGWYSRVVNESGKRSIVFNLGEGFKDKPASVPCGKCVGCQLERARQWAVRCMHEARYHAASSFVTLTYETVPPGGSLRPKDMVDFLKRLRYHHGKLRFFQCGEYGERLERPHHHALLFGYWPSDAREYVSGGSSRLYRSRLLEEVWSHGRCMVGSVSFQSAGYVARYALKKVVGPAAAVHYSGRVPEYLTMSRRPGIGRRYVEEFGDELYGRDFLVVNGVKCRPPRYYDEFQEREAPDVMRRIKHARADEARRSPDNSGSRLVVREVVKEASMRFLDRRLERDS